MGSSNQFMMMMYKGFLLRKRHFIITILEFLIPLSGALIQLYILSKKSKYDSQVSNTPVQFHNATIFEPYSPFQVDVSIIDFIIIYSPNNSKSKQLMEQAAAILKNNNNGTDIGVFLIPVNTEFEMKVEVFKQGEIYKKKDKILQNFFKIIGIVFNNIQSTSDFPISLDYMIRCSHSFSLKGKYSGSPGPVLSSNVYKKGYFLIWQAAVEQAFIAIKCKAGATINFKIMMHRFPFPEYYSMREGSESVVTVKDCISYGFLIFFCFMVQRVMQEKINHSRELLKMMGMNNFIYWSSTFLNYFIFGIIISIVMSFLVTMKLPNGYKLLFYVDFGMIFIFLILYLSSLIFSYLVITTLLNQTNIAIAFIFIGHIGGDILLKTFLFQSTEFSFNKLSFFQKMALCLLPNVACETIFHIFAHFENLGENMWTNINTESPFPDFYLGNACLMLIISSFIYAFLLWYLDNVWPFQPGVPKKFYFIFTKRYWFGFSDENVEIEKISENKYYQEDPDETPGIVIRNISKTFYSGFTRKKVLENVSINIYHGQITALLGPNGAGKTTIINILTGLFLPSSGFASINGYNIYTQKEKARQSLGICPQHNILYETLTVEEHLKLFALLKGIQCKSMEEEVSRVISTLRLNKKRKVKAKDLSGGMKRKLCLGIAIIGGSEVLILDEPTSGMDPEARRVLWDALLDLRVDHTVILTTHYMEEADVLGDRIAFMVNGKIHSCGTPMFLKKTFGTGYRIHLDVLPNHKVPSITQFIANFFPNSTLLSTSGDNTIVYSLGADASGSTLVNMLAALETNQNNLLFKSFGISVTTMDEIFLKVSVVAEEDYSDELNKKDNEVKAFIDNLDDDEPFILEYEKLTGTSLLCHQAKGLLKKNFYYCKHKWLLLIFQVSVPLILAHALFALFQLLTSLSSLEVGSLELNLASVYGSTEGIYNFNNTPNKFAPYYIDILNQNSVAVKKSDNITQYILNFGKQNKKKFQRLISVGGEFTEDLNITVWYNGELSHILPMALNLVHKTLLRYCTSDASASISLTNEPFSEFIEHTLAEGFYDQMFFVNTVFILPLLTSFWMANYVSQPIEERVTRTKLLQLMTGISSFTYWMIKFCSDMLIHFIIIFLMIIPLSIFLHFFFTLDALGGFLLLFILFGWGMLPLCYILSLFIKSKSVAYSIILGYIVFSGLMLTPMFSKYFLGGPNYQHMLVIKILLYLCYSNPSFCINSGFSKLASVSHDNTFCNTIPENILNKQCSSETPSDYYKKCCKDICGNDCFRKRSAMAWDIGCGFELVCLFVDGAIYFALLFIFEIEFFKKSFSKTWDKLPWGKLHCCKLPCYKQEDSKDESIESELIDAAVDYDIQNEKDRIHKLDEEGQLAEALIVEELTKWYGAFCAVDHITFGVHQKECFGLLGVNGAGKTSTFKMLAGDIYPTEGNAFIHGDSIGKNLKRFQSHIGYCPQFDAFLDCFTGKEMLQLFAHLRGIPLKDIHAHIDYLVDSVGIHECVDRQIKRLSGGNKRRLSLALALIGNPPFILLDEPSAGVDPVSRRKIWRTLEDTRKFVKSAIILCTHSMEECEAACSRIAIMVNGQFQCLGSIQYLRDKYGLGYTVLIKLKKDQYHDKDIKTNIMTNFKTIFPISCLKEDHQGLLTFHITDASLTWSFLFKNVEHLKETFDFEDYSISGTSLEQIFLMFARLQK